jgi:hypothetical protein
MTGEHAVIQARLAAFRRGARAFEFFSGLEDRENLADRLRVVAGPDHVLHPEAVRLHLVLAAVAHHPGLGADVGKLTDGV